MQKFLETLCLSIIPIAVAYLLPPAIATVDYSYCRKYTPERDGVYSDTLGRNITFMGHTWDKNYFILPPTFTADFYEAANAECKRLELEIATVNTDCEYGVLDKWFKVQNYTEYSVWIGAVRFGDEAIWYPSKAPVDLRGFGFEFIPGPYHPGGYNSVPYPWINCLSASRNCPEFTSAPTNPCNQTTTKPDLQFGYLDCRDQIRVICQGPCDMPDMRY